MKSVNCCIVALFLCCCNGSVNDAEELIVDYQIFAETETLNSTRSYVDGNGHFSWTEDDLIGVCGYKNSNNRFHYTGDPVSGNVFSGLFDSSKDNIRFGYYPFENDALIETDKLHLSIMEESVFQDNINYAPMIGFVVNGNKMLFRQTGGLLHLSFEGFSNKTTKVVVESTGSSRHYLSGDAVVDIDPATATSYTISSGSYKRVFDISFLDKNSSVYNLFVPLQVGTYSMIEVSIIDDKGDAVLSKSLSDVVIERAKLIETPLLDCAL